LRKNANGGARSVRAWLVGQGFNPDCSKCGIIIVGLVGMGFNPSIYPLREVLPEGAVAFRPLNHRLRIDAALAAGRYI